MDPRVSVSFYLLEELKWESGPGPPIVSLL